MMKQKIIVSSVFSAIVSCFGLHSQNVMTLHECMAYAVENSAKARMEEIETDNARIARRDAIFRAFTPEVSAGEIVHFGKSGQKISFSGE